MKQITDINEVHQILLNIVRVFDNICRSNNIPYYMIDGTMLGAVRHKGFIPWDDDMDFGVPREFYNKLTAILQKDLSYPFTLISMDNCKSLSIEILKISDSRTFIKEYFREDAKDDLGVNIDIFPLDKFEGNGGFSKITELLSKISKYVLTPAKSRPFKSKIIAYILKTIFLGTKQKTFANFINRHLLPYKGDYIGNVYGAYGDRETVHKDVFGSHKEYAFEDIKLYGVSDPDTYLKVLYGDYMQLPPENKRHIHIDNVYWK